VNTLEALRLDGPIAPWLPAELADRFEFAMCCIHLPGLVAPAS